MSVEATAGTWSEGFVKGWDEGVSDERARCIKVLEDLRGSRLWTSLAHDALNEAIAALKTNASSSSGQG